MKTLREFAQSLFLDYAYRKTGVWVDWNYLSNKRKLVWLREVHFYLTQCFSVVKEEIKPNMQLMGSTSYEKGFLAGQDFEFRRLQGKLQVALEKVTEELHTLENTLKKP
jgi:hypothetical protein